MLLVTFDVVDDLVVTTGLVEATTRVRIPVTPMERMMVDSNDDGRITGVDANALYFQATSEGDVAADPAVRRTLFKSLLPLNVDRNDTDAVDEAIDDGVHEVEAALEANKDARNVNGGGMVHENDAGIIRNVKTPSPRWSATAASAAASVCTG